MQAKRFAWPFVQVSCNRVELKLRVARQIHTLGQVLSKQSIRVLVAAALPWALRIAKVNLDVGDHRESLMPSHLFASIPSQ